MCDVASTKCVCAPGSIAVDGGKTSDDCAPPVAANPPPCSDLQTSITQGKKVPGQDGPPGMFQCTGVAGADAASSGQPTAADPTPPWSADQIYLDHYDDPFIKRRTFPGNQAPGTYDSTKVALASPVGCFAPQEGAEQTQGNCSRGLRLASLLLTDAARTQPQPAVGYDETRAIGDWQQVGNTFFAQHKIWGTGAGWTSGGTSVGNVYPRRRTDGAAGYDAVRLRVTGDLWNVPYGPTADGLPVSSDLVPLTPGLYETAGGAACDATADPATACGGSKLVCEAGTCKSAPHPTECYNVLEGGKSQPTCLEGQLGGVGATDACLLEVHCDAFREREFRKGSAASPSNPALSVPALAHNLGASATTPDPPALMTTADRTAFARCGACLATQDIWGPGEYEFVMKVPGTPHDYDGAPGHPAVDASLVPPNLDLDAQCMSGYIVAIWLFSESEIYTVFQPSNPDASSSASGAAAAAPDPARPVAWKPSEQATWSARATNTCAGTDWDCGEKGCDPPAPYTLGKRCTTLECSQARLIELPNKGGAPLHYFGPGGGAPDPVSWPPAPASGCRNDEYCQGMPLADATHRGSTLNWVSGMARYEDKGDGTYIHQQFPSCVPSNDVGGGGGAQGSQAGDEDQVAIAARTYALLGCAYVDDETQGCALGSDDCNALGDGLSCQSIPGAAVGNRCMPVDTTDPLYAELKQLYLSSPTSPPDPPSAVGAGRAEYAWNTTSWSRANNCAIFEQSAQTGLYGNKWCGSKYSLNPEPCTTDYNLARWHRSVDSAQIDADTLVPETQFFAQSYQQGAEVPEVWGGENIYAVLNHEIDIEIPANTPATTSLNTQRAGGAWGPESMNVNTWLGDNNSYTAAGPTPWYTQAMVSYDWPADVLPSAWPEGGITAAQCNADFRSKRTFMSKPDPTGKADWGLKQAWTEVKYRIEWYADEDPTQSYVKFTVNDQVVYSTSRFVPTRGGRWVIGPFPARWGSGYQTHGGPSNAQPFDWSYVDLLQASFRPYNASFLPEGKQLGCLKLRSTGSTYDQALGQIPRTLAQSTKGVVVAASGAATTTAWQAMTCGDYKTPTDNVACEIRCGVRELRDWASLEAALFPGASYTPSCAIGDPTCRAACTQPVFQQGTCAGAPASGARGAAAAGAAAAAQSSTIDRSVWLGTVVGSALLLGVAIGLTVWLFQWAKRLPPVVRRTAAATVAPTAAVVPAAPAIAAAKS